MPMQCSMHLPLFFALQRRIEPYFDNDGFPAQLLALVLVEKPIIVQVGSFCTSNLSSGTTLQQDFVIRKVR